MVDDPINLMMPHELRAEIKRLRDELARERRRVAELERMVKRTGVNV